MNLLEIIDNSLDLIIISNYEKPNQYESKFVLYYP
jgi:hypothetical protein